MKKCCPFWICIMQVGVMCAIVVSFDAMCVVTFRKQRYFPLVHCASEVRYCPVVSYMVYSLWCFSLMRSVYDDRYIPSDVALRETRAV
jgi:hypothetical protein